MDNIEVGLLISLLWRSIKGIQSHILEAYLKKWFFLSYTLKAFRWRHLPVCQCHNKMLLVGTSETNWILEAVELNTKDVEKISSTILTNKIHKKCIGRLLTLFHAGEGGM